MEEIKLPNGKVVEFKKIGIGKFFEIRERCKKWVLVGGKPIEEIDEAKFLKELILNCTNITEDEYYNLLDIQTFNKISEKLNEMLNLEPSTQLGK